MCLQGRAEAFSPGKEMAAPYLSAQPSHVQHPSDIFKRTPEYLRKFLEPRRYADTD